MKRFLSIIGVLLFAAVLRAQPFALSWLSHPAATVDRQVWFRADIQLDGVVAEAVIDVCTTGVVDIYLNERNISADVLIPHRDDRGAEAVSREFNVRRFLCEGENSVAIWYSPLPDSDVRRQVSAVLRGRYADGRRFAFRTGDDWICRLANRWTMAEDEKIDAAAYGAKWNSDDFDLALWVPAEVCLSSEVSSHQALGDRYVVDKVNKIRPYEYFDAENGAVYYEFRQAFRGWVRVTLRGAKSGERILVDGLSYVCKGQTDEQAYGKFTLGRHRRVRISGDKKFQQEQVSTVEAIEIVQNFHSFSFF